MRTMKRTKNMGVLSKTICTGRYSANTQKLEGWWDKVKRAAKCQSDSLAFCKWLIIFERELCFGGPDLSSLKKEKCADWSAKREAH
jgi:hypothetical protein